MAESRQVSRFLRVLDPQNGTSCVLGGKAAQWPATVCARVHICVHTCPHVGAHVYMHVCECIVCACVQGHCAHVCVWTLCTCACVHVCEHLHIPGTSHGQRTAAGTDGSPGTLTPRQVLGLRGRQLWQRPRTRPATASARPPHGRPSGRRAVGMDLSRARTEPCHHGLRGGPRGWLLGHSWT